MSFFIRTLAPVMVQQIDITLKPKRRAYIGGCLLKLNC